MHYLFFITVILLYCLILWFLGRHFIGHLRLKGIKRTLAWTSLYSLLPLISLGVALYARHWLPLDHPFSRPSQIIVFSSFLVISSLFFILAIKDLGFGGYLLGKKIQRIIWWRKDSTKTGPPKTIENPKRRAFLSHGINLGGAVLSGGIVLGGYQKQVFDPLARDIVIRISGLPPVFHNYRIVHLSDLHIGPILRRPFLSNLVKLVNRLDPDLIAITGDLLDGRHSWLADELKPLADLRSKDGVYFVTGNHEYYWNWEEWSDFFGSLGMIVLNNEHRLIQRRTDFLTIAGINDLRAGSIGNTHTSDPFQAIAGAPMDSRKILLAHQPASCFGAVEVGFDLQLSGHTHGGQVFPFGYIVALTQPYLKGLHRHGPMQVFVTTGTGFWGPPVRLGAPAEIAHLHLVS